MESEDYNSGNGKSGRLLRIFTPFVILLITLAYLNYRISDEAAQLQPTAEKISAAGERPSVTAIRPQPETSQRLAAIATAIPNATESISQPVDAAPTPLPTWAAEEVALLAGPPPSSQFSLNSSVAFYWHPGGQLPENFLYGLHIVGDDVDELVGVLSEPNLGTGYQIHLIPEEFDLSAGDYYWQVRLIQQPEDYHIGGSESRPFRLTDIFE